ncbi:MAG: sugar phosphate nucleotidyltransferase [Eubacteriales bacterium]|nr:sugar phosphate nucleotidyltransferase [Eubacteriales bacterium]
MKTFGVIMAGGNGTRLWPLSRENNPKQTITHFGEKTLLENTIDRIEGLFADERIYISINHKHLERTMAILHPYGREFEIISQPYNRNNAPFILFIALKIIKRYGNGVMCLLPSDHLIRDPEPYRKDLSKAIEYVIENDRIVAIGTQPDYPAEIYGYIRLDDSQEGDMKPVKEFKEKPAYDLARAYLDSGDYLWNSGVYVWTATKVVTCYQRYLPKIYNTLAPVIPHIDTDSEESALRQLYREVQDISIDHGIMEQTDQLYAMAGSFQWIDVGSYDSLINLYGSDENGNVAKGRHIGLDSRNNIIFSEKTTVATVGLEDTIVVAMDDIILICKKEHTSHIRHLVDKIRQEGHGDMMDLL